MKKRKSPVRAYLNFLNWFPPITVTLIPKAINIIIDADTGNKWCDNPFYVGGSLRATDLHCLSRESRNEEESHWNGAVTLTGHCLLQLLHYTSPFTPFSQVPVLQLRASSETKYDHLQLKIYIYLKSMVGGHAFKATWFFILNNNRLKSAPRITRRCVVESVQQKNRWVKLVPTEIRRRIKEIQLILCCCHFRDRNVFSKLN